MQSKFSVTTIITLFVASFLIFGCDKPKEEVASKDSKQTKTSVADNSTAKKSAGKLEVVGGAEYKFGEIARGESVVHTFILKNVGKDVVHIKRAKGS